LNYTRVPLPAQQVLNLCRKQPISLLPNIPVRLEVVPNEVVKFVLHVQPEEGGRHLRSLLHFFSLRFSRT